MKDLNVNLVGEISSGFDANMFMLFCVTSLLQLGWNYFFSILSEQKKLIASQEFLEELYYRILNQKEKRDNEHNTADYIVILQRDVNQIISYYTDTVPTVIQAVIGIVVYSMYFTFFLKGFFVLLATLFIGLLQFIPPYIMKKYMVKNYIRVGEAEGELNQQIISGITGFFTIKMLNLHSWYMEQYKRKQKQFQKIGMIASAMSVVQTSMDNMLSLIVQLGLPSLLGIFLLAKWIVFDAAVQFVALSKSIYSYMNVLFSIQSSRSINKQVMVRVNKYIP